MEVVTGSAVARFKSDAPTVVALGVFDGVHLGHQTLLRRAVREAGERGLRSAVLTFAPHPALLLKPGRVKGVLTSLEEKLPLFAALGLDLVVVQPFDAAFAAVSAGEFISDILVQRLRAGGVVTGYNFTFGAAGAGRPALLRVEGRRAGFRVRLIPPVTLDHKVISSTAIRQALEAGEVQEAAGMLGRRYCVGGEVVAGAGRGRGLGFPTANIAVAAEKLLPADGVYSGLSGPDGGDTWQPAVAAVSTQPTFDGTERRFEVHVLGDAGDMYGQRQTFAFGSHLRGIMRFSSGDELRTQVELDKRRALELEGFTRP